MTQTILSRLTQTQFHQPQNLSAAQTQVDGLVTHFVEEAANPATLAAMMAGGMAYRFGRIGIMAAGEGRVASSLLQAASVTGGFGLEVGTFELASRTLSSDRNPNRWNWSGQGGWAQGLTTSAITFGMLKGAGFLGREQNFVFQHAFQSTAMVAGHNTAGLLGIGPRPEGTLAEQLLHAEATNIQLGAGMSLVHSMAPGMAALERGLDLSIRLQEGARQAAPLPGLSPQMAMAGLGNVGAPLAAPSTRDIRRNSNAMMMSAEGGSSGESGSSGSSGGGVKNNPPSPYSDHGSSSPSPSRAPAVLRKGPAVDPNDTLAVLRMGSVTPHGDDVSTHQRAVGNPEWVARIAKMNGYLRYEGEGRYVDAQSGEPIGLDQIVERYGALVQRETGFQGLASKTLIPFYENNETFLDPYTRERVTTEQLESRYGIKEHDGSVFRREKIGEKDYQYVNLQTRQRLSVKDLAGRYGTPIYGEGENLPESIKLVDLPIETDWAGQLPKGLRGEEGETETRLLDVMGLTKKQIRELNFEKSAGLIPGLDQFALQGLYALYRSSVQYGLQLQEIVGHDPRQMGIAVAAGLGGMNNLVELVTAATRRTLKEGTPGFKTDPATGTDWLSSLLIDSMQGAFIAVLGPKGNAVPANLSSSSVIRTVGRNPVNVGACATGYKTLADAADMFRPGWPGQIPTEIAFFGSSEAAHGRIFSRPEATGFNGMKAMETRASLNKRGARLEDGYAPLTTDASGFWPSEGAGVGALMRLARAFELGIPVDAAMAGYSFAGDEGGKPNPAGLGSGGVTTMLEALNMAREWQRMDPKNLQYVSLHGTGTRNNNQVEPTNLLKILDIFGYEGVLRLAAYKGFLGHGLGAAGSMELSLLLASLRHQVAPGAFNLQGRELDPAILALGARVLVSSEVMRGPIDFVGGQSQGFAGNNAAALFRAVNEQVLQEKYGYSARQVREYYSRRSEREGVARDWEERIQKGEATIGQHLSWFGLGSENTPRQSYHFLSLPEALQPAEESPETSSLSASSQDPRTTIPPTSENILGAIIDYRRTEAARAEEASPPSLPPVLDPKSYEQAATSRGPEIMTRTLFPVSPFQTVVTLGEGAGLTPLGSMRTTRRIAMGESDAIAHMAEDAGFVRYTGKENGQTQWRDSQTNEAISVEEINARWGTPLREQSGIRTLKRLPVESTSWQLARELALEALKRYPVGSEERNKLVKNYGPLLEVFQKTEDNPNFSPIDNMIADFGGVLPDYMRDQIYDRMGLTLSAKVRVGGEETSVLKSRIGGAHYKNVLRGTSDQVRMYLYGASEVLNQLGGALPDLYPHSRRVGFAFGACFEAWEKLMEMFDRHLTGKTYQGLETPLSHVLLSQPPAVLANMLGPEFNYAMLRKNPALLDGIVPPNMDPRIGPNTMGPIYTEVGACASSFCALAAGANALTGRLPGQWHPELMLLGASDTSLNPLWAPALMTGFSDAAPISNARLRELGISPAQASMPLSRDASGLVISEAAGSIGLSTLADAVSRRQMISSIVAGWGLSFGEGGKEHLMGMDEGSVAATLEAINMGIEGHGMSPQDLKMIQIHGTSTRLNNIGELISLYKALGAYGGERVRPSLNALKGLIGHSMGAASMVDLMNAVNTLLEQRAPGLFNFSPDRMDERFAPKGLDQAFHFPTGPVQGPIESVLGISEGFGSRNSAVLLRRFDPTILRHYDWPAELKPQVENFIAAWPDIVAKYEADQLELRSGRKSHTQVLLDSAYSNPALQK